MHYEETKYGFEWGSAQRMMAGRGTGMGDGYGNGIGYSSSVGSGSGGGSGDGYGYGDCFGNGYGDYNGQIVGRVGDCLVVCLPPWCYARVGCHVHSLAVWKERWRELARQSHVFITSGEVDTLLCKATSCAAESTAAALSLADAKANQ